MAKLLLPNTKNIDQYIYSTDECCCKLTFHSHLTCRIFQNHSHKIMPLSIDAIFSFTTVVLSIIPSNISLFHQLLIRLLKLTDIISIFTSTEIIYYCTIHKN